MRLRSIGLLAALALGILLAPLAAHAQQAAKISRIGFLGISAPEAISHLVETFRQGLRDLGHVEGQNITIEYRWAEGRAERLPDLARELVRLKVDVIVTRGTPETLAAKHATAMIPIVMVHAGDPVGSGLVASLPRPGGNITGLSHFTTEISAKWLELLKEAVPRLSRVAVLRTPTAYHATLWKETLVAASQLRVTIQPTPQFGLWTWLAEELPKRTKGQVTLDVVSLPELGLTGFELVRVTRAGLVDLADVLPTYVAGDVPMVEAVDLPGVFPNLETSVKAHMAFMAALKKYEDKLGGTVVGGYLWPGQYIFSRKPIRSPADLKGLKIRVYGTAQTEFARALGMEPVSIPFAEVYTALERGTVDAGFTGTYPGFALKWYEVTKYLVDVNHGPVAGTLTVSKKTWDKLSPELREILTKLGEEFSEKGWEIGRRTTKEGIEKNKEKGMELIPASPAMAAVVRDVVQNTVVPSWAKRAGPDAKAVFNQYIAPYSGSKLP